MTFLSFSLDPFINVLLQALELGAYPLHHLLAGFSFSSLLTSFGSSLSWFSSRFYSHPVCFLPFESSADPVLLKLPCYWSVWPHIELMLFCITCWVELDLYFGCVVNTVDFKSHLDFQVLTVAVMWVVTRGLSLPSCLWINLHLYYSSIVDPVSFKCVSNPVLQIHDLETSQSSVYHFYSRQSATDLNYIIGMSALTIECSKIAARCQKLTWHVLSS